MIAIPEDKRAEVIGHEEAGYFIHDWQGMRDQVRQIIMKDNRNKAIKAGWGATHIDAGTLNRPFCVDISSHRRRSRSLTP